MGKFIIAIPSYQRDKNQRTLDYLTRIGTPKDIIYIFVQTKGDYEAYSKYMDRCNIVYAQADRIAKARNNILNALVSDNDVIMVDDDIRKIGIADIKGIRTIETFSELETVFCRCFEQTRNAGATMFGIYPVYNDFFLSKTISTRVAVNTVFGFPKGFKFTYDESYDTKEDAALCGKILSLKGKIFRYNFLAVDADHRKDKNGYIDDWHQKENLRCVSKLCFNYPEIYAKQSGKPWEVRMLIKDKKISAEKKA